MIGLSTSHVQSIDGGNRFDILASEMEEDEDSDHEHEAKMKENHVVDLPLEEVVDFLKTVVPCDQRL